MLNANWVDIARDDDSQTETLRAHFTGHAFDAHWHDSYLIGVTEAGVQQFHSGRMKHQSTPGKVFMLAPGEIHDGDAVDGAGFTYRMLYLPVPLMRQTLPALFAEAPDRFELVFPQTLVNDPLLAGATWEAFNALHHQAPRMVRDHALQHLLVRLTHGYPWRKKSAPANVSRLALNRARDYLQAHYHEEIGLDALAHVAGMDRFRLNREFRAAFGLPPHAWLVQLRLVQARRLLMQGVSPALAAAQVGFADQSHLGRWFRRAYHMTPARYRYWCTNVPDSE
ncbi:AraC family transcriptional regulator [Sodalis praecaptivus]